MIQRRGAVHGKRRLLRMLDGASDVIVVAAVVGFAILGFLAARWAGLLIAVAVSAMVFAMHLLVAWGHRSLRRVLLRRGLLRFLASSEAEGLRECPWIITAEGSVWIAEPHDRRLYVHAGTEWHLTSMHEIKRAILKCLRTRMGRARTIVLLSDVYAGPGLKLELEVVDGDAHRFVNSFSDSRNAHQRATTQRERVWNPATERAL